MELAYALLLSSIFLVVGLAAGDKPPGAQLHFTNRRTLQQPLACCNPSPSPLAIAPRSSSPTHPTQQPVKAVQSKGLPAGAAPDFAGHPSRGQARPEDSILQSAGLPAKSGAGPFPTPAGQAPPEDGSAKAAGDSAGADEPPPSPRPRYWLRGQTQPGGGRVVTSGVPGPGPAAPAPAPSEIPEQPARTVGVVGVPAQGRPEYSAPDPPFEVSEAEAAPSEEDSSTLPTGGRGLRTQPTSSQRRPLQLLQDPTEGPSPFPAPTTTTPRSAGSAPTEQPGEPVQTRGLPLAAAGGGAPPPAATLSPRPRQAQPEGSSVETGGLPAVALPSPPPTSALSGFVRQQPEGPVETAGVPAPALPASPPPIPPYSVEMEVAPSEEDGSLAQLEGLATGGRGLRTPGSLAQRRALQEPSGDPPNVSHQPTFSPWLSGTERASNKEAEVATKGLPEFSAASNSLPVTARAQLPEWLQLIHSSDIVVPSNAVPAPEPATPGLPDLPFDLG